MRQNSSHRREPSCRQYCVMMTRCMLSPIHARGGMQQDTEVINTPMIMERYCSFVNLDTSGTTSKIRKLIKIQPTWAFVLGTSCFVLIVQNN